jgi:hypothetical protein
MLLVLAIDWYSTNYSNALVLAIDWYSTNYSKSNTRV